MNNIALYCRAGFEKELAAEITEKAADLNVFGFAKIFENEGLCLFTCYQEEDAAILAKKLSLSDLIFARQMVVVGEMLEDLDPSDRITPILAQLENLPSRASSLVVETLDNDKSKELSKFCKKFINPLRQRLKKELILQDKNTAKNDITIFVIFVASGKALVGYGLNHNINLNPMGIMRLKFPQEAPSRSTLKLEEAILTFITKYREADYFSDSMTAVDLGACPGGWSYQLAKRGLKVFAVDHGKIDQGLLDNYRVIHCNEDGFSFKPTNKNGVDYLVCDMAQPPMRVTELMTKWLKNGWTKKAIFNLKLPMKKRYVEVMKCLDFIESSLSQAKITYHISAKHLYHNREEITVFVEII